MRLPVIVEPNLPRFVRPGDQFTLAAIGRVVEGGGGPGQAPKRRPMGSMSPARSTRTFDWATGQPQHLDFTATVPTPVYDTDAGLPDAHRRSPITLGVQRTADKARDAFLRRSAYQSRTAIRTRLRHVESIIDQRHTADPACHQTSLSGNGTLKRSILRLEPSPVLYG